ncbi:MAG: hypothetical protein R3D02_10115 [Hyphomicrobiales bacterium]
MTSTLGYKDVQSWVKNNDRIIKPNYVDPIADAARKAFDLREITQAEYDAAIKNAGDRAIKALASGRELDGNTLTDRPNQAAINSVKEFAPDGAQFQVVTEDGKFWRNIESDSGKFKPEKLTKTWIFR